ncbi:unnamed protein product [Euphydryas editha]|uniref:Kazal-like domain-containing protein n=1 Tax=Euphydryas editha TaxID=104508 RepID=A0AAU9U5G4_EUPED|nr:unnamed protein product [Euphydryas editha]
MFVSVTSSTALCECNEESNYVCGTDGLTYDSCMLNCTRKFKPDLEIYCYGNCSLVDDDTCNCPKILLPVCASDGKSYSNRCMMKCVGGSDLTVVSRGMCKKNLMNNRICD